MTATPSRWGLSDSRGFTLIELLVSVAVLALLLVLLAQTTTQTRLVASNSSAQVEAFKETRAALEAMVRRCEQATLNSYWGYDNPDRPTTWLRQSELHFVATYADPLLSNPDPASGHCVFFQAPFGYAGTEASAGGDARFDHLSGLLNGWGYYVEYNSDLAERTPFLNSQTTLHPDRRRLRLMECRIPSEELNVMRPPAGVGNGLPRISTLTTEAEIHEWFSDPAVRDLYARPIAENVVALIVSPRIPDGVTVEGDPSQIAPDYKYDSRRHQYVPPTGVPSNTVYDRTRMSRHQLPPVLDLTVVAVSEDSWIRFEAVQGATAASDLLAEVNTRFRDAALYEDDLEELSEWMRERRLEPRVFRATLSVRGAKFTTEVDA